MAKDKGKSIDFNNMEVECEELTSTGTVNAADLEINSVAVTATAAEINAAADKSAGAVVSATAATLALTQATHAGKIVVLNRAAGVAVTLPEATGTGDTYTVVLGTAMTSASSTIKTADAANADFVGYADAIDADSATTVASYQSLQATGNDVITMNRTTQGGVTIGCDFYEITDIATDVWWVRGRYYVPAGSNPATPFSST